VNVDLKLKEFDFLTLVILVIFDQFFFSTSFKSLIRGVVFCHDDFATATAIEG
jgi:hypothetical protein